MMGIYMQLKWKERQRVCGGMGRIGREVSGVERDSRMRNRPGLLLRLLSQQCKWPGWWRRTDSREKNKESEHINKTWKYKHYYSYCTWYYVRRWMRFTIIRRHLLSFWAPQHPSSPSRVITAPIVMMKIPTLTWLLKSSVKGGKTFIKESPSTVTHIPAAAKHMPASCQKHFPLFTFTNTPLHFYSDMLMCKYK